MRKRLSSPKNNLMVLLTRLLMTVKVPKRIKEKRQRRSRKKKLGKDLKTLKKKALS